MKIINKFEDSDGCPDVLQLPITGDADGDGLLNASDDCPYSPETYNKFQDEDGCPDFGCRWLCCL